MDIGPQQPLRPNILLINCDDLGYGDIGCYGSTSNRTPHIDQLAQDGIRFTDFYMASSVCSPSRGAMLTGSYPPRIGFGSFEGKAVLFPGQSVGLHPNERTIAAHLSDLGYATALVGKWHCGDQDGFLPTDHGFDHYFGLPFSNDMGMMKVRPKVDLPLPLMRDKEVIEQQPDQTALTERYVAECLSFIRNNRDRPFFLYLAHMHVHLPLLVARRFRREGGNGDYGAAVECIDWATGTLMAELEDLGLDKNTIVIFTSDNGSKGINGGSNEPLRGGKATPWEGGMRLPCIMRWPAAIQPGRVSHEIFSSLDFLPTLLSACGIQSPDGLEIDGLDFSAYFRGEADHGPREEFFYYFMEQLCAVRKGRWKLHVRRPSWGAPADPANTVCELYDLEVDPGETTDVAASHPDIVSKLEALLDHCRQDLGDSSRAMIGKKCRASGKVNHPRTLTQYNPDHPYVVASYDGDAG